MPSAQQQQEDDPQANNCRQEASSVMNATASIWDEKINQDKERERCHRYGLSYDGRITRRRVFLGAMIADDSFHVLRAVAAEGYGIYHSVAFVESNYTQALHPRKLRFTKGSKALRLLKSLYGPYTKVTVDNADIRRAFEDMLGKGNDMGLLREDAQRERILHRWNLDGMQPEDIGIVADADETFTRDFMRAVQICNIPNFAEGHGCLEPRVVGRAMVFESTPDCITKERIWWHPDLTIGECLEHVGNERKNKPLFPRAFTFRYQLNMTLIEERRQSNESFPLINTADVRLNPYGIKAYPFLAHDSESAKERIRETKQPYGYNAYHFHNFFGNASALRRKYSSYGHANPNAYKMALEALQEDVQLGVSCVMNRTDSSCKSKRVVGGLDAIVGPIPIFFQNKTYRRMMNEQWRKSIEEDEAIYGRWNKSCTGHA